MVAWTAPEDDGGEAIAAYDLRYIRSDATDKADAHWTVEDGVWTGSGSLEYVVTGLGSDAEYDVQVRAVNAMDSGPWSATVTGTTAPPPVPTDPCVTALGTLTGTVTETGGWASGCESTNRSGSYAHFYTFTLEEETEVTIELTSEEDTYLFLLQGEGRDGTVDEENDDIESGVNTNSRITKTLAAGDYTVEATTYSAATTGEFTLSITGPEEDTSMPAPTDSCVTALGTLTGTTSRSGAWADDCDSTNKSGSYARFYTFTLEEETEVTVELTSEEDTYLFLLQGEGRDGTVDEENDDIESGVNTNSRITKTLAAGDYTVEATTYSAATTGEFTLSITGPEEDTSMPAPTDSCVTALGTLTGTTSRSGAWADDCDSTNKSGSYARFYTFTLEEETKVTIDLTSEEDT
jgi:hypothetical protein